MGRNLNLFLAPIPKRLSSRNGIFDPTGKRFIRLIAEDVSVLAPAARKAGFDWELTASSKVPIREVGLIIRLDNESNAHSEGYTLSITPNCIEIIASDPAGAFYGACTLVQIKRQCESIPCLSITDWPDFSARGVMLDISRDKVPTMETLYHIIDLLSEWKINQFQLYTEHTFQYFAHPIVWEHASSMTGEQILDLQAYCKSRFVELVPNQNSFGHMERWLKHPEYNSMAEAPNGCNTIWGWRPAFSLCPIDKRSIPFVRGLYDELLPHFSSRMFNVGCDETIDLGCGRSKRACKERGKGRVYLDFLLEIQRMVEKHGRTMQFWGDIILEHPELVTELPSDVIALEWGYEADHPFAQHGTVFQESEVPFYVCPGTSSWNTISGRTDNAVKNIASAAKNGLEFGAIGLLNTDWGDNGHWQPLSISYLGYMAGAMAAWNVKADFNKVLPQNLSIHAFKDSAGKVGQAFYDLGNVYLSFAKRTPNWMIPWYMLFHQKPMEGLLDSIKISEFEEMSRRLDVISGSFAEGRLYVPDADIIREEFAHMIQMLRLSSEVGKWRLGGDEPGDLLKRIEAIKKEQEKVWLARNRSGGLSDSLKKIWAE